MIPFLFLLPWLFLLWQVVLKPYCSGHENFMSDRNRSELVYTYLFWRLLAHMVLPPWRGHENSASFVPLIIPTTLPRTSSNFMFLNMSSQTYVECFRWGHISAYTATVMQFFSYSLGSHLGFFIIASHWCFIGLSGFLFTTDV